MKEKQEKTFWLVFMLLFLLNSYLVFSSIKSGSDSICVILNLTKYQPEIQQLSTDPLLNLPESETSSQNLSANYNISNINNLNNNSNLDNISNPSIIKDMNKTNNINNTLSNTSTHTLQLQNITLAGIISKIRQFYTEHGDYLWLGCSINPEILPSLPLEAKFRLWSFRLIYTPFYVLTDLLAAILISLVLFKYREFKLEHTKKDASAEEKGRDNKEKTTK